VARGVKLSVKSGPVVTVTVGLSSRKSVAWVRRRTLEGGGGVVEERGAKGAKAKARGGLTSRGRERERGGVGLQLNLALKRNELQNVRMKRRGALHPA